MGLHGLFLEKNSLTVSTIYVCAIVVKLMFIYIYIYMYIYIYRFIVGSIIKGRLLLTALLKSLVCLKLTFKKRSISRS